MKKLITCIIILCSFALAACGAAEPESVLPEPAVISTSTPDQVVEYGATLEEYSEAVNAEPVVAPTALPIPVIEVQVSTEPVPPTPVEVKVEDDAQLMSIDPEMSDNNDYSDILWDALVPADFSAEAIMDKYSAQLANIVDGSDEASTLYSQMQEEFNSAPVNEQIDGQLVKLPGFIAPLEYEGELITKFLLVPYFGACVHSPAPPVNQTVLVDTAEGEGISLNDSYAPIYIKGVMTTEKASTELAESGYYMQDAVIEPYD